MNKIFIIGLPRTGTTSICVALLQLGLKVAHTAYTKRAFELADAIADAPCFSDYAQLDQLFPGAKFVYLQRAPDLWVPSMQRLLTKMLPQLHDPLGYLHPLLKRSMKQSFALETYASPLQEDHLIHCYQRHQQQVNEYFTHRDDLLELDISQAGSLRRLIDFLGMEGKSNTTADDFPHLNIGKQVDSWKAFKHPNKINALSAGVDHKKFFDYTLL
jgi:hypothetical protein